MIHLSSVRGRLLLVTAGVIFGFCVMVAVAWVSARKSEQAMQDVEQLSANL